MGHETFQLRREWNGVHGLLDRNGRRLSPAVVGGGALMLSPEQCVAQSNALCDRALVERMAPREFRSFADWLDLSDVIDAEDEVVCPPEAERGRLI